MKTEAPLTKLATNTDGFCKTMTLPAKHNVDNVMHMTNLAGRRMSVGRPTKTAKTPKPAAAKSK